ncbi:Bgt-51728 [Blumeria graminis f. sp. tritici]|uniref:Bgt-51728 n=1 Tax=Blumeria graminis f. sp. tritici TaxID=62690 RepID=A0A9X9L751_BLUGR|nr:Bgt-51728 [Blumeria graminis f. sp. tritici]
MNANLVLALLSKHPHPMYIKLAAVTPSIPSTVNLSCILKAASLPFSYVVISSVWKLILYNTTRWGILEDFVILFWENNAKA